MKTLRRTAVLVGFAFVGLCVQPAVNGADPPPNSDPRTGPKILCQPSAESVDLGVTNTAVFQVMVESEIPLREDLLSYRWEWTRALGDGHENWISERPFTVTTNQILVVPNVSTSDVAFYRVRVQEETNIVISEPASLIVYYHSESITAFGPPKFQNLTTTTACPGAYGGHVTFYKGTAGWWTASNPAILGSGPWEIQDRGETKGSNSVEALQYSTWRRECAPFRETRLTFPSGNPPTAGSLWRFVVYFPRDVLPPASPYQVLIKGFQ